MKTILVDAAGTFVVDAKINEEMHILLDSYPNRKIIMTNANDEQKIKYGLVNMPYEMFTLNQNPTKVEPVYFETFLKQYNLKAEDCIYFEHAIEAVKSAESVGIKSYHYDSEKRDLKGLKEFIESNL